VGLCGGVLDSIILLYHSFDIFGRKKSVDGFQGPGGRAD